MTGDDDGVAVAQSRDSGNRWETIDAVRKTVQDELKTHPNISYKDVDSFRFCTRRPKDGVVFDYPNRHYIESGDELAEHADLIGSILEKHVSAFERRDISTRTDGKANRHYWVIRDV